MSDHLSALQGFLLNQHVHAAGAQNTFELLIENSLKIVKHLMEELNMPNACANDIIQYLRDTFVKHCLEDSSELDFKIVFNRNFESYFDVQPPFQLDKAILSGSFSEGPHIRWCAST